MVSDTTTSSECTEFERIYVLRLSEHRRIPYPVDCGWHVIEQLQGTFVFAYGRTIALGKAMFLALRAVSVVEM